MQGSLERVPVGLYSEIETDEGLGILGVSGPKAWEAA